jgi:hypothetical protein
VQPRLCRSLTTNRIGHFTEAYQDNDPSWVTAYWGDRLKGYYPDDEMDDSWYDCIGRLTEFINLRSVALIFDRHGGSDDTTDYDNDDVLQSLHDRVARRDLLFRTLGQTIKDLSIRHHQEWTGKVDEADTALHNRILSGLHSLRMNIVHEQIRGGLGNDIRVCYHYQAQKICTHRHIV